MTATACPFTCAVTPSRTAQVTKTSFSVKLQTVLVSIAVMDLQSVYTRHRCVMAGASVLSVTTRFSVIFPALSPVGATDTPTSAVTTCLFLSIHSFASYLQWVVGYSLMI